MNVAITINEVIRSLNLKTLWAVKDNIIYGSNKYEVEFDPNFGKTTKEAPIINKPVVKHNLVKKLDIKHDPFNLYEILGFKNIEDYDSFLYHDSSFETLGQVNLTYKKAMQHLNLLNQKFIEQGHNITLISQEKDNSKIATLNFLARHGCKANNFKFLTDYSQIWKDYDVIITANPYILKSKPKRKNSKKKIVLKIASPLNSEYVGDFNFLNLEDFINTYNGTSFEEMIKYYYENK